MYPLPEFLVGDKVLVKCHMTGVWYPKYDAAYPVGHY